MTAFISYKSDTKIAIIDGSSQGVEKTIVEGEEVIQLRKARTEESHFNWENKKIKEVIIKNVLVYDGMDISCLSWFIKVSIKINASQIFISPRMLQPLINELQRLEQMDFRVVKGSSIVIPQMAGMTGWALTDKAMEACRSIGFEKVQYQ